MFRQRVARVSVRGRLFPIPPKVFGKVLGDSTGQHVSRNSDVSIVRRTIFKALSKIGGEESVNCNGERKRITGRSAGEREW